MAKTNLYYGCTGRVAAITGGTSGIGLATAALLLEDGAHVFILGRNAERGRQALAELLRLTKRQATYLECDVTSAASCRVAMQSIAASGKLDFLVNSAGKYSEESLAAMTESSYQEMLDVNLKGVLQATQAALPYFAEDAAIVNVASDAGVNGNRGCVLYCVAKGAVVALTRALALDLAPRVRVNCVCPADVATPLVAEQLAVGELREADLARAYPLARIGQAAEIAHVIVSTLSPANSFMTGSIIMVDGGLTAQ